MQFTFAHLFHLGLSECGRIALTQFGYTLRKNIADNTNVERLSNAIASNGYKCNIRAHVGIDIIPRTCVRIRPLNY